MDRHETLRPEVHYLVYAMSQELRNVLLLAVTAAWSLGLAALGAHDALLYLAPALLLALPLAFGRYFGEDALEAVRVRRELPRPRPAPALAPARWSVRAAAPRGGRLVALSMALRGPPLTAAVIRSRP
jgi:hypothetical protein